jgi:hypothetical protein
VAADAALKELLRAHHKQMGMFSIIVIPWLFTLCWRRLFHKVVDLTFTAPPGFDYWPINVF